MVAGLNLNVLVADDNKINRLLISKIFAKWGVTADFVENGAEAVKKIESNRNYDVVLMDIHMPEMDGFEATKHLKSNPELYFQQLPIIALTASMLEGERSMISDAGMDYILKPFDSKKLYDKLSHFQKEEALVK